MFTEPSEISLYIQFMFTLVHKELVFLDIACSEICHISFIQPTQIHIHIHIYIYIYIYICLNVCPPLYIFETKSAYMPTVFITVCL